MLIIGALLAPVPVHAQDSLPAEKTPLGFHVNGGDPASLAAARAAGAQHVVIVFSWRDIEPTPGYHYWYRVDEVMRTAAYNDLEVIARLDRPPEWALSDNNPTPWRLDAYADFVSRVAARYGEELAGIILWNEPNLSLEWHGRTPDPLGYAALLAAAYPAAKAQSPQLPVLMAGLASTLGDGVSAISDLDFLRAVYAAGGGAHFDALALHPYGFGRAPAEPPAPDRLNFRRLELQRAIMTAAGDATKPGWITEMGWRTDALNPADSWQVVTPAIQEEYTLRALASLATDYPWIQRATLWEISTAADGYGYGIWHGPDAVAPLYKTLVARASPSPASPTAAPRPAIEILAPDAAVRLGDIGTLHPHWVHLDRGGENFSPLWSGRFFLNAAEAARPYTLLLETMQVDQPTNSVLINGQAIGRLATRTRPDPTSTWAQQQLDVDVGLLQPGVNTLTVLSGLRAPVRQYADWRWENFQLRDAKLVVADETTSQSALPVAWQRLANPPGWAEINRIRHLAAPEDVGGGATELWVTGNGLGQLWRTPTPAQSNLAEQPLRLASAAGNITDRTFTDIYRTPAGLLAATDQGLLQRATPTAAWEPTAGTPAAYAYVVTGWGDSIVAGFEDQGVWIAEQPVGPWRLLGLPGLTVLDIGTNDQGELLVATSSGVYVNSMSVWRRLPDLPLANLDNVASEADRFITRLAVDEAGGFVVRNQDRLWQWRDEQWQPFGPPELAGASYSVLHCCGPNSLIGSDGQGLWQRETRDRWVRVDAGFFDGRKLTGGATLGDGRLVVATENGLFLSADLQRWRPVAGLTPTVTDLLIDPHDPQRWYAATPAGIYGSANRGAGWALISPPWVVWDLAWGAQGRLLAALGSGLAWTDDAGPNSAGPDDTGADAHAVTTIQWTKSAGMADVTFFTVAPHPADATQVWAGSWGNDVGRSNDGGVTLTPVRNGLETLSVPAILQHPTPGQLTVGTIEGLYRSDDDGATWFKLPGALRSQTIYSLLQADDGALFAGAADGLWQSADYGSTWSRVTGVPEVTVLRLGQSAPSGQTMSGEAQAGAVLWAGTEGAGLWQSLDGGATWQSAGLAGRSVYAYHGAAGPGDQAVVATDDGIFTALPLDSE